MTTTAFRRLFAAAAGLAASLLSAAPAVPLVNLVDDQTLFAVSVTDTPALLRGWDSSPLAATWNDPQISKFLAPLRADLDHEAFEADVKEATGLAVSELLALAEGEALIAVPKVSIADFGSKSAPPVLFALEVGSQAAKVEKLLADTAAKKSIAEETEEFSGAKVHLRPLPKPSKEEGDEAADTDSGPVPELLAWTIVDGVWIISFEKERVFAAIDALKQGGLPSALGKSERFLRARERVGDAQGLFYLNFTALNPLIRELAESFKARSQGRPNPMGVDSVSLLNAFGLDALNDLYAAIKVDVPETRLDVGLGYTEERGLLKLLAYQPGPSPQPAWIPAKWPNVSTGRYSPQRAYAGLEEFVETLSPLLSGLAQGQIRALNKKLGVDLVRDLIGSLGEDLVSGYALPPGVPAGTVPPWDQMDQLFAVSLVNEPAFTRAIEALKSLAGPQAEQMFLKRDYLGTTIYTFNSPPKAKGVRASRGFSYAIANGMVLVGIGSPGSIESALQGMASPQDGFWKRADVREALAGVPNEACSIQVQDLGVMMASFVETAVNWQESANAGKTDEEKKIYVDPEARPDPETLSRIWGLASGYSLRTPEGLFTTTRLANPKK